MKKRGDINEFSRRVGRRLSIGNVTLLMLALMFGVQIHAAHQPPRPNIIVILADDMGFSDLGCYGGELHTPNLDRLAANGVRFTQFYNTARCCPTRASLLTGLYPHQAGIGHMMDDRGYDGYRGDLNHQCATIPEVLKPAGYRSYAVGKWHVTRFASPQGPKDNWPLQRGFDRYYGTIHGAGSYFDPATLTRDNTPISPFADPEYQPKTYYYTDAIADHAIRFIGDHQAQHAGQPFFLYVAFTAAHWPMHALPEDIAKQRGKYDLGYAPIRNARYERMKKLGVIGKESRLSPQVGDWSTISDQKWEAACMEVYAAMVDRLDQGIGRIVEQLKNTGQLDNTLILFMQDNGACAEPMGRSGTKLHPEQARADHPTLPLLRPDSLLPVDSVPPQTRDGYPVLMGRKVMPGGPDTYIAYGREWANVSNTPFREYKHWVHEGGISTPLIAHWPAGIAHSRQGKLEPQPGHLVDIMATCVDLAGATYPSIVGTNAIKPMEGVTLLPAFSGKKLTRPNPLFWEHEGNRAVRDGKWKLVAKDRQLWELYDMSKDRSELTDLAEKFPDKVRELTDKWDAYAARTQVFPVGGWRATSSGRGGLNKELRFVLRAGDELTRDKSPAIVSRSFTITAIFNATTSDGVIVAQGGSSHGYALYLQNGKLTFGIRRAGKLASVSTLDAISGRHTAHAALDGNGAMRLSVDGQAEITGQADGLLTTMPGEGLDIGADTGGAVGSYKSPNRFGGTVESVVIELSEPKQGLQK